MTETNNRNPSQSRSCLSFRVFNAFRHAGVPLLLGGLAASSLGCWLPNPINPSIVPTYPSIIKSPSTIPPSVTPSPGSGQYSDPGIEILGGSLTTTITDANGAKLKGAWVRLYGLTMATTTVDSSGQGVLGPLAVGTGYRAIVGADGYATVQLDQIEIKKRGDTPRSASLSPEAVLSGHVMAGGGGVEGAVVSDGLNSATTDSAGAFELHGVTGGQVTLTAAKTRFQTATRAVTVSGKGAGNLDLTLAAATPVVYFDTSVAPGVDLAKLQGMRTQLTAAGWEVVAQPPTREGVWVLVSPSVDIPNALAERITSFVAQGGKLIIFGEWGGYGHFRNPSTNSLAHAVGLHFNPDLVRDPGNGGTPEWLHITSFQTAAPAMRGISGLKLYESCSLFGLPPMTKWAQTSSTGYRVQDNAVAGAQPVVMAGPYKGGKAVAIADASGFSDDDTDGNGTPNLKEANNSELIGQLFNW
ncbi:MAG: uncharacterized protein JWM80_767 [Cyanobacteria bacterium RYN_339]|nr:uncharacterized protein [Cyanobacteria bacterium RYN_339]